MPLTSNISGEARLQLSNILVGAMRQLIPVYLVTLLALVNQAVCSASSGIFVAGFS